MSFLSSFTEGPLSRSLPQSIASSLSSLADNVLTVFGRAGGRAPDEPDRISNSNQNGTNEWEPVENLPTECRLIILQITDVYTLENLAHFKTLVEDTRAKSKGAKVVAMLTGDFLSPYLLSTVDHGFGMMKALGAIPLDYIIWGNHEADSKCFT